MINGIKNINISSSFGGFKKSWRPKERMYPEFKQDNKTDTVTIFGKEVKKKTVAFGIGAFTVAATSFVFVLANNIKKGKFKPVNTGLNTASKPKTGGVKPKKAVKPKAKSAVKTNALKPGSESFVPVQPASSPSYEPPVIKSSKEPARRSFGPDEIKAEALKRIDDKKKFRKGSRKAQRYFLKLNDSRCGKSAEESAKVFEQAFKREEVSILRMANGFEHLPESERSGENILKVIEAWTDGVFYKTDELVNLYKNKTARIIYAGPTNFITEDGKILMMDGKSGRYIDLTRNFMNRARGRFPA